MCSGITAFSALKKVRTAYEGEAIAIVGLGGVGMMGLQFARAMFPNSRSSAAISTRRNSTPRSPQAPMPSTIRRKPTLSRS